ncbi:MAG: signal peptidase II [Syntrophomonadaceae bacterium]|nr:signal peptidase II [Syntrophomonadaceae bacterium]
MRFLLTLFLWLVLDRVSKLVIINNFTLGDSITIIPGIFNLTFIQNQGAAFGILQGKLWFFIWAAFLVIGLICYYNILYKPAVFMQYMSGLIVAGALGNLIDRIFYNGVIDFLSFGWFPIFNVADIGIVAGSMGFLVYVLFLDGGNNINAN